MLLNASLAARQGLQLLLMVSGACALHLLLQWPLPACSRQILLQAILLPSREVMKPASGITKPRCLKSAGCESGGWHRACSCPAAVSVIQLLSSQVSPLAHAVFVDVVWQRCSGMHLLCANTIPQADAFGSCQRQVIDVSFGWTNMAVLAFCAA